MKNEEIREMTMSEIFEQIDESKLMLTRMKLNHAVSPLDNPMKIKATRRDIARLKTELHYRELEGTATIEDENIVE